MFRANDLIAQYEEKRQLDNHTARHRNAYQLDFDLSDQNLDLINAIYEPCIIHPKPGILSTSHPIAAAQQRIASIDAYRWAKTKLSEGLIEIGPNPASFAAIAIEANYATTHGCTKPDGRDQSRYMTADWSKKLRTCRDSMYRADVQQLRLNQTTNKFCVNGFQNCFFRAPNAIAVHSLYDISLPQLAAGFYNHGTEQLRAWMHLPYEMLQVDNWTNKTHQFTFKSHQVNGVKRVQFGFLNDPSFMYEHDYDTWTAYMTTSCFNTQYGFALLIERVKQHGTQVELRITRTSLQTNIVHTIPTALSRIVAIPNLTQLARSNFCSKAKVTVFYSDANKVNKLTEYLLARDNKGFSMSTCLAYARSLKTQVKVGQVVYEEFWDITRDFNDICVSVFVMCEFQRQVGNEVLMRSFRHMDKIREHKGILSTIFDKIYDVIFPLHVHEIKEKFAKTPEGVLSDSTQSRNHFAKLTIHFFDDLTYSGSTDHTEIQIPHMVTFLDEPIVSLPYNTPALAIKSPEDSPQWVVDMGFQTGPAIPFTYDNWQNSDHQLEFSKALDISILKITDPNSGLRLVLENALKALPSGNANNPNWDQVILVTGPPGSGKSSHLRKNLFPTLLSNHKKVLYITPTSKLRDEMRSKITSTNVVVHTVHTAMTFAISTLPDVIIIDECYTYPSATLAWFTSLTHGPRVIFLGDPKQIQCIDFEGCWFDDIPLLEFEEFLLHHKFTTTYRCPKDVAALAFIQAAYPGLTSQSSVDSSIEFIIDKPALYHKDGFQHISFTQLGKACYSQYNSCTVHESQGQTFENVILHLNTTPADIGLVKKSPSHLITAVTRHTNKLYICDETISSLLNILNDVPEISIPLAKSNIDIQAIPDTDNRTQTCITERINTEKLPYATCSATLAATCMVLQDAFPMQPQTEYQSILDRTIPEIHAKATLRPHALGKDELYQSKTHTVHTFPEPQRVKVTRSTDQRMSLISMAKRSGAKTKNLPDLTCSREARRLFKLVNDEFIFHVDDDDLRLCYYDAALKFTTRGHDLTDLLNITDWNDQSANKVKNFLKAQQKPSTTSDPLTKAKAGQGISAWSKTLNFQITIWTRMLEHIMTKQSKGRVIIATGYTDEQMMSLLEQNHSKGSLMFENDWTEFDSSQNNLTHSILALALQKMQCPIAILAPFLEQLANRKLIDEFLTIEVQGKKDSGSPHTLIDNCLFNLAIHLDILSDFNYLYIKGDDVLATGRSLKWNLPKMDDYHKNCGYQFKPSKSHSCGFVSFIVNDFGAAYDLPRLASKVLTRNYTNLEDYTNYQESIQVILRSVTNDVGINMTKVNHYHHNTNYRRQTTQASMDILLSFLVKFSKNKIPFTDLITRENSTLFCDPKETNRTHTYKIPRLQGPIPKVFSGFKNAALTTLSFIE